MRGAVLAFGLAAAWPVIATANDGLGHDLLAAAQYLIDEGRPELAAQELDRRKAAGNGGPAGQDVAAAQQALAAGDLVRARTLVGAALGRP